MKKKYITNAEVKEQLLKSAENVKYIFNAKPISGHFALVGGYVSVYVNPECHKHLYVGRYGVGYYVDHHNPDSTCYKLREYRITHSRDWLLNFKETMKQW